MGWILGFGIPLAYSFLLALFWPLMLPTYLIAVRVQKPNAEMLHKEDWVTR